MIKYGRKEYYLNQDKTSPNLTKNQGPWFNDWVIFSISNFRVMFDFLPLFDSQSDLRCLADRIASLPRNEILEIIKIIEQKLC